MPRRKLVRTVNHVVTSCNNLVFVEGSELAFAYCSHVIFNDHSPFVAFDKMLLIFVLLGARLWTAWEGPVWGWEKIANLWLGKSFPWGFAPALTALLLALATSNAIVQTGSVLSPETQRALVDFKAANPK